MKLLVKRSVKDYILYSVIIAVGILADQLTKILTFCLMNVGDSITLIPGVLNIKYVRQESRHKRGPGKRLRCRKSCCIFAWDN